MAKPWSLILKTVQIDLRGLAVMRIILGLILTVKFWGTVPRNFEQVFSPTSGLLGNCFSEKYIQTFGGGSWLYHQQADATYWVFAMVAGAVMFLFMLGIYPQVLALIGSVLLWMWNDRFPTLWFGWEQYAQVLLTLAIFLPTGHRFGVMAGRHGNAPNQLGGPLVLVLLVQIGFIYFFNGISKNGDRWMDGSAVQFAMAVEERRSSLAEWMLQQDFLGAAFTYLTLVWECTFLPLLFFPWKRHGFRTFLAISIPAFHFGLSLFMDVGDFKYVGLAACAVLLPAPVWDRLPARLQTMSKAGFHWPQKILNWPRWLSMTTAGVLIFILVGSNLKMSFQSQTPDRMKHWLGGGVLEAFVGTMLPDALPRTSFFAQHWHLFSPNPPSECGYLRVEITQLDGTRTPIFDGLESKEPYPTKTIRFLMQYLAYGRSNRRSEMALNCMAGRETERWHKMHPGQQAKNLCLTLYSWRPENLAELKAGAGVGAERIELIRLGFDY